MNTYTVPFAEFIRFENANVVTTSEPGPVVHDIKATIDGVAIPATVYKQSDIFK